LSICAIGLYLCTMKNAAPLLLLLALPACSPDPSPTSSDGDPAFHRISRATYANQLEGFWLGQSIANWTGLITEMDKLGGEGFGGQGAGFYTRDNWGGPDEPNIWGGAGPSPDGTIGFFLDPLDDAWGADDDTDVEYMYMALTARSTHPRLTGEEIREGWLRHIYSDDNTPFTGGDGTPENYLWVSNQMAHDLMREGAVPPETSDPERNPFFEMIDAQLTTEIFGLFAPGMPDVALDLAYLPIRTTARRDAAWIAEFYVIMHSLAPVSDASAPIGERLQEMAAQARHHLPDSSYSAAMYDFVHTLHASGAPWEVARDSLYQRYQVRMEDGYDVASRDPVCGGCFAAGINFGAGMISLLYGDGDIKETIKIGALAGWDSDNPTATWGGLIGFMLGRDGVEEAFGRPLPDGFNIHRTRGGFDMAIDSFPQMAARGVSVVDRVIAEMTEGLIEDDAWHVPTGEAGQEH
jgi:ADP-ribosylglycohydrolase